jgi:APA family basic amino acid/polyamine antiporter
VTAATFTILAYYAITNLAALRLPPERMRYPRWIAALGLVACVVFAASLRAAAVGGGIALLAAGFGLRLAIRKRG